MSSPSCRPWLSACRHRCPALSTALLVFGSHMLSCYQQPGPQKRSAISTPSQGEKDKATGLACLRSGHMPGQVLATTASSLATEPILKTRGSDHHRPGGNNLAPQQAGWHKYHDFLWSWDFHSKAQFLDISFQMLLVHKALSKFRQLKIYVFYPLLELSRWRDTG